MMRSVHVAKRLVVTSDNNLSGVLIPIPGRIQHTTVLFHCTNSPIMSSPLPQYMTENNYLSIISV